MFVAVGRGRKDAKALSHALKIETMSLGGGRRADEIELPELHDRIPVFFFGREEIEMMRRLEERIRENYPIYQIALIGKKRVRNARMEELRDSFEISKAKIRLGMRFNEVFEFSVKNEMNLEIHPDFDSYFLIGERSVERIGRVFGIEVEEGALILRALMNEERIYVPRLKAIISKRIGSEPSVIYENSEIKAERIELGEMIERNKKFLEALERISLRFIRENAEGAVGVPFSGGKDSLAALILSKRALGDVRAIYIRTNYDFPKTEEYVEEVCRKLGVELITGEVSFDVSTHGLPTHQNRWCTAMKLEALKKVVDEEGIETLVVGDRDGESRVRRKRDFVERRVSREIFPIKHWSGAMVQLYVMMRGFELHPMYLEGLYRIGCTICPSLSKWEKIILQEV